MILPTKPSLGISVSWFPGQPMQYDAEAQVHDDSGPDPPHSEESYDPPHEDYCDPPPWEE